MSGCGISHIKLGCAYLCCRANSSVRKHKLPIDRFGTCCCWTRCFCLGIGGSERTIGCCVAECRCDVIVNCRQQVRCIRSQSRCTGTVDLTSRRAGLSCRNCSERYRSVACGTVLNSGGCTWPGLCAVCYKSHKPEVVAGRTATTC